MVYELSRARLFRVGPPGAWFDDVTIDFRDGAATLESSRTPARAAVLVGDNGTGKTVLLDLVQSVLTPEDSSAHDIQHHSVRSSGLSHVVVEYQSRAGNQVVVGMVLTGDPDSSHTPDPVRRSWYVFTPTEQFSLDAPPFTTADTSLDDVAGRVRATAVDGSGPNWFSSYADLHAYIHSLGFPVGLHDSRQRIKNLWRQSQTEFRYIDRELIREVLPTGTVDRLVRHVEASRKAAPDTLPTILDALRIELLEAAQEVVAAFRAVGRLSSLLSATGDDPVVGIDTDSIMIAQSSDELMNHLVNGPRLLNGVEELVLSALERMCEGGIEITVGRRSTSRRGASFRLLSGRESLLFGWAMFSALALIKSRWPARGDGDVVGTLFIDDYVDLLRDPTWLARAFKVSRAMGFQVVLSSARTQPGLAAADVVIGIRNESTNQLRKVEVTTHTRTGVWRSRPEGEADPGEEVMEHVPLTDVFDFVPVNDHVTGDSAARVGDIVLSAFVPPMFGSVVQEPGTVEGDFVVVLRPVRELDHREKLFYRRYFNSEAFTTRLLGRDRIAWLRPWNLSGLRIPRPDTATLHALSELAGAARQFSQWSNEAEHAVRSYFKWDNVTAARSHMINAGRLTRQRREAGSLIDARESRLRTTLPFPIATRWRAVQAARHDHGGYAMVLECAEAVLAYCGVLGLVLARADDLPVGPLRHQANRFAKGGSGPTFGTWGTIVDYLATANPFRTLPADSLLAHFARLAKPEVSEAIAANKRRRDHNAHRRGPSPHETRSAFEDAKNDLLILLEAVEWLVDFPLRHIEHSRWDTFEKVSHLAYRELMGDHNVVSLHDDTIDHIIEADSPYAVDQFGRYHLLRPFFVSRHCDKCGQLTVFVIDEWDPTAEAATYLALDHAHTIMLTNQRSPMEQVGLLPPSAAP
ncbi:hypothetical protein ABZ816_33385 [Actinosynnema sp. NPDC047251]|nr:hypothetical protein [Saccharothrix espanaensis]